MEFLYMGMGTVVLTAVLVALFRGIEFLFQFVRSKFGVGVK